MILTKFRNQYEMASLRLGQWCSYVHLKPNVLTFLSLVFGILAGIALWFWYYKAAILCMAIAGFLDVADGATARYLLTTHPFGTVLDRVNDRYVEFVISLGLLGMGWYIPFGFSSRYLVLLWQAIREPPRSHAARLRIAPSALWNGRKRPACF